MGKRSQAYAGSPLMLHIGINTGQVVAGGFGDLKGKVFRVGCMGEVHSYHVMRTLSSIASAMNMIGVKANPEATTVALEKLKGLY